MINFLSFTILAISLLFFQFIPLKAQDPVSASDNYKLARELYRTSPEEAIKYAEKAIHLADSDGDLLTLGNAHFLLGFIYEHKEDITNAFHYYFGAIGIYGKLEMTNRVQQLYENLSYVAENSGVHEVAEKLRRDRLLLVDQVDYKVASDMHYDLGLSLKNQNKIPQSLDEQLSALKYLEENPDLSDTVMYGNIWLELGILYYLKSKPNRATTFLDSALLCYGRAAHFNGGDPIHLYKVQNNRGNVLRVQKKYYLAKKHLYIAIRLAKDVPKLGTSAYYNLGRVYFAENRLDSALWAFTRSLEMNIGDLNYSESQDLIGLNLEVSKTSELFGTIAYLDSMGKSDMEIKGQAILHVFNRARERYDIINANNHSLNTQLYEKYKRNLANERRWAVYKTRGMMLIVAISTLIALWFWWRRFIIRKHNRMIGEQMEKRLKDKYGIELKE